MVYGVYLHLSINTFKPVFGYVINTLSDHVNGPLKEQFRENQV